MKKMYRCSDSVLGIFSAVYDAWKAGRDEGNAGIALKGNMMQELFCEYESVEEQERKVIAVENMILKNLGAEVYEYIYHALLSHDVEKGNAVWGTLTAARKLDNSTKIMQHLSNPMVLKIFELKRNVAHEAHQFTGFVRFKELENGVLLSEITPKNQVLTCIADHFSNRLPLEDFMIYDKTHKIFLVHQKQKHWALVEGEELNLDQAKRYSRKEKEFELLWKGFCKSICIDERASKKRQIQHLPLRYQQDMVEFK